MKKVTSAILICAIYSGVSYAHTKKPARIYKNEAAINKLTPTTEPSSNILLDNLSGTFAITSNYIFRGISQSNNLPAFQGGLTYTFPTPGIYLNVWGSNVSQTAPDGSIATLEIDTVIGISNSITQNFNYNLSLTRYNYPKASQLNYNEAIGVFTYRFFSATVAYSNNVFNTGTDGLYTNLGVNFDLPSKYVYFNDVSINGSAGHYNLSRAAGNSYNDYSVGVKKKISKIYSVMLQWTNTNHRYFNNSLDQQHIVGTVSASF